MVDERGGVDLDNDGLLDLVVLRYVQWNWEMCGAATSRRISSVLPIRISSRRFQRWCTQRRARTLYGGVAEDRDGLPSKGWAWPPRIRPDGKVDVAVANDSDAGVPLSAIKVTGRRGRQVCGGDRRRWRWPDICRDGAGLYGLQQRWAA